MMDFRKPRDIDFTALFNPKAPKPHLLFLDQTGKSALKAACSVAAELLPLKEEQGEFWEPSFAPIINSYFGYDYVFKEVYGSPRQIKDAARQHLEIAQSLLHLLDSSNGRRDLAIVERLFAGSNLSDLEVQVRNLVEQLEIISKATLPGGRPSNYLVDQLVARIAAVWEQASGQKFQKTILKAKGKSGKLEFVSSSPYFVQKVSQAIDPSIKISQIETAIKHLDDKDPNS